MRTRSLLTTLACTAVLAGVGAETAFADSSPASQPTAVPTTTVAVTATAPSAAPSTGPSGEPSVAPITTSRPAEVGSAPSTAPPTSPGGRQISVVPSGAPNTGVPTVASNGHGEAAAVGASLVVLLGGSGTMVLRRRLKGRG